MSLGGRGSRTLTSESHQCYDSDFWAGAAFYSLGSVSCSGPHPLLAVDPLSCSCRPKPSTASCCGLVPILQHSFHLAPWLIQPYNPAIQQHMSIQTATRGRTSPVLDLPSSLHCLLLHTCCSYVPVNVSLAMDPISSGIFWIPSWPHPKAQTEAQHFYVAGAKGMCLKQLIF